MVLVVDVVKFCEVIFKGCYKDVNMVGVVVIVVVINWIGWDCVLFVFGGDGVILIVF